MGKGIDSVDIKSLAWPQILNFQTSHGIGYLRSCRKFSIIPKPHNPSFEGTQDAGFLISAIVVRFLLERQLTNLSRWLSISRAFRKLGVPLKGDEDLQIYGLYKGYISDVKGI